MMSTAEPHSDTLVISLPDGWFEIPVEPDELTSALRELLSETLAPEAIESIEFRRQLVLLRRLAEQAQQGGIVLMAAYSEDALADAEPEGDGEDGPYFLTVLCYLATRTAAEMDVEHIAFGQLQQAVEMPRDVGAVERVEDPRVIELRNGPTVRDVVLRRNRLPEVDGPVEVIEVRYHQLIGAGEGMSVLGFVTPNVELAEDFVELFDSIADSLEFVAA